MLAVNSNIGPTYKSSQNYYDTLDWFLCRTSFANKILSTEIDSSSILHSDHYPMLIIVRMSPRTSVPAPSNPNRLNFNKANWRKFSHELEKQSINSTDTNHTVNTLNAAITSAMLNASRLAIPSVSAKRHSLQLPSSIVDMIRLKRKLRRQAQRLRTSTARDEFKTVCRQTKRVIMQFRNNKWANFVAKVDPNPISAKPFWQRINRFRNNPESNTIPTLKENNRVYKTDQEKADLFALHLATQFSDSNPPPNYDVEFKNKVDSAVPTILAKLDRIVPISDAEVRLAINEVESKLTVDPFGLCNSMLKSLPESFKVHVRNLLNLCLTTNDLPADWKKSVIIMIRKKADHYHLVKSFRPISLTSVLCKLNEKIMQRRMSDFMQTTISYQICNQDSVHNARLVTTSSLSYKKP